jgi:phenylalanine-4-hydroxylase
LKQVPLKKFSKAEHETWKMLFERQAPKRSVQIIPQFEEGLEALGINGDHVPDLDAVNAKLRKLTGWEGVPVEGLEEGESFYRMLSEKKFPIGNFIRDQKDLSYTPAPDIFHDLYGHIPFYADLQYAEYCQEFGKRACAKVKDPKIFREYERFFWFTVEFGLVETPNGRRIFGAGIASSYGECEYALSSKPKVIPFDVNTIRAQEFRIDVFQETLFVFQSVNQLYKTLNQF